MYTKRWLHCFEFGRTAIIEKIAEPASNGMRSGLVKFETVGAPIIHSCRAWEAVEHTRLNRENQEIPLMTKYSCEEMN
jgi:hypothetical protein